MSTEEYNLRDIKGIGPVMAERLREAGLTTVEAVAVMPAKQLAELIGVSEDKAMQIAQAARELLGLSFMTAEEYYQKRQKIGFISTGCSALDNLLGGGIETQAITEFVGEYGSGKTQLCHQLSIMVQLPRDEGGLEGKALYIDTEGTFRPERIVQIAQYRGLDPTTVLRNVIYARAYNSDHQMLLAEEATKLVEKENVRLIIVDSLVSHFRSEYPGREQLAVRQQRINRHIHQLLRLADIYNIAVVVTNQVMSQPDIFFGNPMKPAGGNVVAHGSTYRVWLRKSKNNKRIARIFDSPKHPESEAVFAITEEGIVDVEEGKSSRSRSRIVRVRTEG
ncbi:MAG: DNA repair and recombination protein RadA [Thermoprotei archaeon]|nr:DNA repair and recombination protein RadA [Thermoprotei archaeon]